MSATLSIVGTPIGNLEDISPRALRMLRASDVILCEDTRVTRKLLGHYGIDVPLVSYHAHSGVTKEDKVLDLLAAGNAVALVSDAGTPAVSDPGARLVAAVYERFGESVPVRAVPGPSAVTAALSVAGVPADSFLFLGFPPHKKGRRTFFATVAASMHTVVFYESPHRIEKALAALAAEHPDRLVVVCRELTKLYEEVVRGSAADVAARFASHRDTVRGEFVVVVPAAG